MEGEIRMMHSNLKSKVYLLLILFIIFSVYCQNLKGDYLKDTSGCCLGTFLAGICGLGYGLFLEFGLKPGETCSGGEKCMGGPFARLIGLPIMSAQTFAFSGISSMIGKHSKTSTIPGVIIFALLGNAHSYICENTKAFFINVAKVINFGLWSLADSKKYRNLAITGACLFIGTYVYDLVDSLIILKKDKKTDNLSFYSPGNLSFVYLDNKYGLVYEKPF